jgi:RimJ/RimL family protein N-acetyltransferase
MIKEISAGEFTLLWPVFLEVVGKGDTYAYSPAITEAEACALWTTPPARCFILEHKGEVVGGYMLRPNQPGLGDHVANAGYMVGPQWRGRGFAGEMCQHSLAIAREAGFLAMQFNFVVSTNATAVRLWEKHGFTVVGRVPSAFRHAELGPVDVLIMYRSLD